MLPPNLWGLNYRNSVTKTAFFAQMASSESRKVFVPGEEGSPLKSRSGRPVRIEEIRAKYNKNNLYQDPDFPPTLSSIGDVGGDDARKEGKAAPASTFRWLRPHDICKQPLIDLPRPEFAVAQDSFSKSRCSEYDIEQSSYLGDCWYVCALQALAKKPEELAFVIPDDNYVGFDDDKYCGAFHFQFYIIAEAKWVDVVIDDLLPVDQQGLPAFAKVKTVQDPDHAEFWVALIEKAYAKLHGSYLGIEGGYSSQALENFSGGFSEIVDLKRPDTHNLGGEVAEKFQNQAEVLKGFVLSYSKSGTAFLALDSYGDNEPGRRQCEDGYTRYGLVGPHAYTILDVQEVNFKPPKQGSRTLLKLKNPWSSGEWTGAYSDADDFNWGQMERDLRQLDEYGSTEIDEGIFWMDLQSVIHYFNSLEICHFGMTDGTQLATAKGVWAAALQGQPDPAYMIDMLRFKAYKFKVEAGALAAKASAATGGKTVVCYTLVLDGYNSALNPSPQFNADLYALKAQDEDLEQALNRGPIRQTNAIGREASTWTFVDPGWYVIVPWISTTPYSGEDSAFPPELRGKAINFALRVFTENVTKIEEVTKAPKYENQRPTPPDQIADLVGQLRNLGLSDIEGLDLGNYQ